DLAKNKQNYYKKEIERNKNVWQMVNKLTGGGNKESIDSIIIKNFKKDSKQETAGKFNHNFIDLTKRLKEKYKRIKGNEEIDVNKNSERMKDQILNEATVEEFTYIIKDMKHTDAAGIDEISLKVIKLSKRNS